VPHRLAAVFGRRLAAPASSLAWLALAAFCLVIEAISSTLEEVSSIAAACSLAPWARLWLAEETCPAAAAVCSEPADSPAMIRWSALPMPRVINQAVATPKTIAAIETVTMIEIARSLAAWTSVPSLSWLAQIAKNLEDVKSSMSARRCPSLF
jgi:hypothetical protein